MTKVGLPGLVYIFYEDVRHDRHGLAISPFLILNPVNRERSDSEQQLA